MFQPLIDPADLRARLAATSPGPVVMDCRFSLADPAYGRAAYLSGHIPGATYAHLDEDLSSPVVVGVTGRHPLPDLDRFAASLAGWRIHTETDVVCYDDGPGAFASRLWWLLRFVGHRRVAVLDGGWKAWTEAVGPVETGPPSNLPPAPGLAGSSTTSAGQGPSAPGASGADAYPLRLRTDLVADADFVERVRADPSWRVIDARETARYRGIEEPIDPVAGRIPGAVSAPWVGNVGPDGRMRSPTDLASVYGPLLDDVQPDRAVVYCGSGVTASHDILAMEVAGFHGARLYPGSWSEWITRPERPTAKD